MTRERNCFLADTFHQIAVRRDDISLVIDDFVAEGRGEMFLGNGHADRIRKPLSERTSGGLDARRMAIFGMSGSIRAELAKALDLINRHRFVAGEIEQGVDQHRTVAGREHEAIAVGPGWIGRVEFQEAGKDYGRYI